MPAANLLRQPVTETDLIGVKPTTCVGVVGEIPVDAGIEFKFGKRHLFALRKLFQLVDGLQIDGGDLIDDVLKSRNLARNMLAMFVDPVCLIR